MRQLAHSLFPVVLLLLTATQVQAQNAMQQGDVMAEMRFDETGMVMNANASELPRDCARLAGDVEITVRVGKAYAEDYPGTVFGMSQHEFEAPPCSRVTVTFVNEDEVRHQWMLHGLPRYLYPQGMFHLEAAGGEYLTRDGKINVLVGDWNPSRVVIFKWPNQAALEAFLSSEDYQPWKALRESVTTTRTLVQVEGIDHES